MCEQKIGQNRSHDPAPQTRRFLTGCYYTAKQHLINPCAAIVGSEWRAAEVINRVSLDKFLARLLQDTLLEVGPLAEELLVCGGGRMFGVLDCGELHGADVVRRL